MRNFLISGASGLLAREIIKQVLEIEPDIQITALSGNCAKLRDLYQNTKRVSIWDWDNLDEISFEQISCIIHCAFARAETGAELQRSLVYTKLLLQKASVNKTPFIGISSRSVYGQNPDTPWTEESAVSPNGLYALAKSAQELLTEQAGIIGDFPYTNLRLAGLMGIGMDARLVNKLVLQAVQTGELNLIGGSQQFALLDIRDAVAAVLALTNVPVRQWKPLYNVGHFEKYTLEEISTVIKQVAFCRFRNPVTVSIQERDVSLIDGMDCSLFYNSVGWRPQYSLTDTVSVLFDYYMEKN